MTTQLTPRRAGKRHPGPPLAVPAIAFVVLFIAGAALGPVLGHNPAPSPFDSPASATADLAGATSEARVSGLLLGLSAAFLLVFSAITWSRLTFLGPNAPGPAIAGAGGIAAAVLLAVSGGVRWVLGEVPLTPGLAAALNDIAFAAGGPLHTALLAPLVFGFAVTAWFVNRTPRWLSIAGFGIALLCLISTAVLVAEPAAPLLLIARFLALAWLVVMSLAFPRERGPRGRGSDGTPLAREADRG